MYINLPALLVLCLSLAVSSTAFARLPDTVLDILQEKKVPQDSLAILIQGLDDDKPKSKFSLPFLNRGNKAEADIPAGPNGVVHPDDGTAVNGKRRQLILAGLVLLAAVSAYGFRGIGGKPDAPRVAQPAIEQPAKVAKAEPKPLPAAEPRKRKLLRRVGCEKNRLRKHVLPGMTKFDQVIAVGTIAMEQNHRACRRAVARIQSRAFQGHLRS